MSGSGFSREKFNAREVLVSSDVGRLQVLANRDLQNLLGDGSSDGAAPISAFSGPCSLTGIVSSYQMLLSAAQAFFYNPTDSSLTVDDSAYEVLRWPAQNLTFANPSGSPRIDLVVATPAMVDADSQSRNVLVDPVARTITPQNVFKTTNPLATLAVVTGTPGGSPVPPAVPAGAVALFEVWIATGLPDSTSFAAIPRLFRRAPFPFSTMSAIVSGFFLNWDLSVNPATTSSAVNVRLAQQRVLIDGELIDTLGTPSVFQDAGGNNPFAAAAPGTHDTPYFLYAMGGRHCPQGNALGSPIAIVESLVAPSPSSGQPLAAITGPRGTTTLSDGRGAVYIGLGFVVAGTVFRRACIMSDEFTTFGGNSLTDILSIPRTGATADLLGAPASMPDISTRAVARIKFASGTPGGSVSFYPDNGAGAISPSFSETDGAPSVTAPAAGLGTADLTLAMPFFGNRNVWVKGGHTGDIITAYIRGYNHRVNRLAVLR